MKRCIVTATLCLMVCLALAAEEKATSKITYEGGDGSTQKKAIVIKGATNSFEGIQAERAWIKGNHPTWRKVRQALVSTKKRKHYDKISYEDAKRKVHIIWYDITHFFGKY